MLSEIFVLIFVLLYSHARYGRLGLVRSTSFALPFIVLAMAGESSWPHMLGLRSCSGPGIALACDTMTDVHRSATRSITTPNSKLPPE